MGVRDNYTHLCLEYQRSWTSSRWSSIPVAFPLLIWSAVPLERDAASCEDVEKGLLPSFVAEDELAAQVDREKTGLMAAAAEPVTP